ncbi:MAG: hypothetical protein ACO1N9_02445 [Flavobacterium sp.]|uniref:hypothetical protein n=1 Tax=Flavobacterium sp. J372 TaxID=2898436 RepID=UPI0021519EBC|nr:hypothetical protein [Flavobacterium sp. J372]MCR5862587.1 hypothetical protein [Flavobacterium sp. J372]
MRILLFILSFSMLAATALPCCAISDALSHTEHHSDDHGCSSQADDGCSDCLQYSFCNGCGGFFATAPQTFEFPPPSHEEQVNSYPLQCQIVRNAQSSIWQPPRVS